MGHSEARRLTSRCRQIAALDIPGGGQIVVAGNYAYVGHMRPPFGTSIIDISDKRHPRVVGEVRFDNNDSHGHKVRVIGDLMITNVEQDDRHTKRRARALPGVETALASELGRTPTDAEIAARLGVTAADVPTLRQTPRQEYRDGGFRIFDIADRTRPREIAYQRTGGVGVHRFDADSRYAYISTEMEGFAGNILVVYDIADPTRPEEVSRWWMPGQNVAAGETPNPAGLKVRLHHAMRHGDELWAACWYAGIRVLDASNIRDLRTVGSYDYHPAIPEPTHTVMPFEQRIGGRRIALAIDEEHDHKARGRLHAFMWVFDVSDLGRMQPLSVFTVNELDSPFSGAPGRFGAHQFREKLDGTLVYATWFSGGLRIVDLRDPTQPEEVGFFIPEPLGGQPAPQSNDVDVDDDGLIYLIDRHRGLHIVEFEGS